jgi:serine protease Do
VNAAGEVIGVTSLRMGDPPAQNLVIPVEHFAAARDELLGRGRVESRRPRPWLGLLTQLVEGAGVVIVGVSPAGPSAMAGFRRGDLIVKLNGESVGSQEEFYQRLWARAVGDEITLLVRRAQRFEAVTVRAADRYRVYRTTDR